MCIDFNDIISPQNFLAAWQEFLKGKKNRQDVQKFQISLMDNIITLHEDLRNKTYKHGAYEAFNISDPKPRNIHKATVRDRLLHHALYRLLYPSYDSTFIAHSYSCRKNKGTHKALDTFGTFTGQVSVNYTKTAWVLKCDIRKFFASIDHGVLINILEQKIADQKLMWLLREVVGSFETMPGKGLPLGNLTSQLLVNIYMNEFDQWIKHQLKVKYYIRYADDFAVLSQDRTYLNQVLLMVLQFLEEKLKLQLHPNKVSITTISSGVDFLGFVHFPYRRILRTVTKRRMLRNVQDMEIDSAAVQSYLGMLSHGDTFKVERQLRLMHRYHYESTNSCI